MRIYLQLGQVMATPTQPRRRTLTALRRLLALAETHGIYLDITGNLVWQPSRSPAWYDRMTQQQRWRVQARFWQAVAHTAASSPAVLCYELTSEPNHRVHPRLLLRTDRQVVLHPEHRDSNGVPPTKAVAFFKQVGQALRVNPLPTATHRPQRHPAEDPAELDRSAGRCEAALPEPVVPPKEHAGPVQAARPHRERVQDPAQLGPRTDRRAPSGLRRRAKRTSTTSSPRRRHSSHQLLELSQQRDRELSQHAPGIPPPSRAHRLRRGQHAARRGLRPDQQPRWHAGHPAQPQQHLQADIQATGQ